MKQRKKRKRRNGKGEEDEEEEQREEEEIEEEVENNDSPSDGAGCWCCHGNKHSTWDQRCLKFSQGRAAPCWSHDTTHLILLWVYCLQT